MTYKFYINHIPSKETYESPAAAANEVSDMLELSGSNYRKLLTEKRLDLVIAKVEIRECK